MNDQQWRDKLQKHFDDYGQLEPKGLWEEIERGMIASGQPGSRPLPGRILYWGSRLGAAAAMIAAALWIGYIAFRADQLETETTTGTIAENPPQTKVPTHRPAAGEVAMEVAAKAVLARPTRLALVTKHEPLPQPAPDSRETTPETEARTTEPGDTDAKSPGKPATPENRRPPMDHHADRDILALNEPAESKISGWSARIVASSIPGSGSKGVHRGYGKLNSTISKSDLTTASMLGENAMTDIMILNQNQNMKTYTEAKHNPPVRAGVMLSHGLTDRLSIEGGPIYTHLDSRLRSGSEQYYYQTRQLLHNLGIQSNLSYSLWRNDRLRVYLSTGGMMEWNISGSASTEYIHQGRVVSKENERVRIEGLQWSVNASVGLQLDISPWVGVFADPGVSYHFDNGSPVETVYKKNPLNFDLTFGLRISFD